ncbi:uncharacterized protein P174DRAFT_490934 [Aspergillus novofumigatus IBT 16806]|uniref:Uncharacterized protein n=1 Tax=Aspergillus novofumigatus (strain IBT 16806) TaxID=1392255 RepID=A0A2I1BSA0_ASPN1|nr:uncharacterized protein P174DRAFT_490934 [Aspergillus novofumigatus IBT 16806]PKX88171.1 hypothetical protein P174DRAFT_490934 [Aspergillus novofumigatus IBT 16806]
MARVFTTLASSAQVLPVPAPFSNSSYNLSFWGPSYKCQRLNNEALHGTAPSDLNNTVFISAAGSNPLWNDNATQPTEISTCTSPNGIQTLTPISVDHIAYANWNESAAINFAAPSYSEVDPTVNAGFYIIQMILSGLLQGELVQTLCLSRIMDTSSYYYKHGNDSTKTSNGLDQPQLLFLRQYGPASGLHECAGCHDCVRRRRLLRPATKRRPQNNSFSSVLMTTRNPELDRLAVGHCLGFEPLRGDIDKVRLQFGEVEGANLRHRHAAFGSKGSVTALSKGEDYY